MAKIFKPVVLFAIIAVCGGVYAVYSWWHSPASTVGLSQTSATTGDVLGSEIQLTPWQTTYFNTSVPTDMIVRQNTENQAGPIYASYVLDNRDRTLSDQLAITIGSLGNGNLAETSPVKFRSLHATDYAPTSRSYAPPGAIAFSRTDGFETDVFWQHGHMYVSAVITGGAERRADLEQILASAVSAWQWR